MIREWKVIKVERSRRPPLLFLASSVYPIYPILSCQIVLFVETMLVPLLPADRDEAKIGVLGFGPGLGSKNNLARVNKELERVVVVVEAVRRFSSSESSLLRPERFSKDTPVVRLGVKPEWGIEVSA